MCEKIGCLISNLLYFTEKFAVWIAGVSLVGCIILTLIMMLALGIGLGYNYCYVDYQSRARYRFVPPHYVTVRPYMRRQGNLDTNQLVTNGLLNKILDDFSNPKAIAKAQILKTNSEKPNTYIETPSTKMIIEKTMTESTLGIVLRPSPKIIKYYKFWALPVNTTAEPAVTKNINDKDIEILDVPTNGTDSNTTTANSTLINIDSVKRTEEIIGVDDTNSKDGKLISINGMDLMALLSQLRAENRNYSLQILTS